MDEWDVAGVVEPLAHDPVAMRNSRRSTRWFDRVAVGGGGGKTRQGSTRSVVQAVLVPHLDQEVYHLHQGHRLRERPGRRQQIVVRCVRAQNRSSRGAPPAPLRLPSRAPGGHPLRALPLPCRSAVIDERLARLLLRIPLTPASSAPRCSPPILSPSILPVLLMLGLRFLSPSSTCRESCQRTCGARAAECRRSPVAAIASRGSREVAVEFQGGSQ